MCRSIKTLRPPYEDVVTAEDCEAAALQYVRKVTGFRTPSKANQKAFDAAVRSIARTTEKVLDQLVIAGR